MPFTPSHIAAVLPLCSGRPARRLSPGALAIGSMIPDLPYFVPSPLRPPVLNAVLSHSAVGVFSLDLVCGLLVWWCWRRLLRAPVVDLLPDLIRRRLPASPGSGSSPTTRMVSWAAVSVVVGALSHVVWDSFTHEDRWATNRLPILGTMIAVLPVFHWLQYLSGVLGLAAVALWSVRRLHRRPIPAGSAAILLSARARHTVWVCGAAVVLACSLIVWVLEARIAGTAIDRRVVVAIVTRDISVVGALVLGYAVAHTWVHRRRGGTAEPERPSPDVISKTP